MQYIRYFRDMMKITGQSLGGAILYFIVNATQQSLLLLPPIAGAGIVAVLTTGGSVQEIWIWAALLLVFYGIYYVVRMCDWKMYKRFALKYHVELQAKLLTHIGNNDSVIDSMSKGRLLATITDDIRWVVDVMDNGVMAVAKIINLVIIFVVFASNNIWIGIMAVLVDITYLLIMDREAKKFARHYSGARKYEDKATDVFNSVMGNSKQIKVMGLLPGMVQKYRRIGQKWQGQYRKWRLARERMQVTAPWTVYIGKTALYVIMAYLVIDGQMTVDKLVLLISYFEQMVTCTDEFRDCLVNMSRYGVQTSRIRKILSYTQKSEMEFGDLDNDYIQGLVEFQNVSLKRKGQAVLKKVSFKARPNEITAIIGPKGAGKTSIVNLLHRLERLSSGQILIDGENIYNYSKKVHNSNVSGVFQKPFALELSIRDNLAMVDKNRKNQEEVCKQLGLDKIIKKLPQGYDTIVTEDESALTEGDKQLLAVARAVLSKAEILVFDEVSSVGAQAIPNLAEILEDLRQDHTIILITHEKDLIKQADRVIELENGKVVRTLRKRKK